MTFQDPSAHPLYAQVQRLAPGSLLAMGRLSLALAQHYHGSHPHCKLIQLAGIDQLHNLPRCDLAIVTHTLEHLDKASAGVLISRLRDLYAKRLLIMVPMGRTWTGHVSVWERSELLAFGLVQVSGFQAEQGPVHIYGFDIATYKHTPDWLNSRYWAHPELFGKYWW